MLLREPSRLAQVVKLGLPLLVIFWSLHALLGYSTGDYADTALRTFRSEKASFVSDFLEHDIEGGAATLDGAPLRALCESKQWRKNLILSCEPVPGGLGQVRNAALNCIRLAIEAGVELLLPTVIARDPKDITKIDPSRGPPRHTPLSHFFDVDHLNATLSRYCPQMRVHASVHDLYDVPSILEPLKASHRDMGNIFVNGSVLAAPELWGGRLLAWVDKKTKGSSAAGTEGAGDPLTKPTDIGAATLQAGFPIRVNIERSIFTWPSAQDPTELTRAFGRLLRVRSDARRIAATVLFRLHRRFRLSLDPRRASTHRRETFVGVHLRTERDVAVNAPNVFPEYARQAADYASYVAESKIPVVFLATGATMDNVTAFSEHMARLNVTVATKLQLLDEREDGAERAALEDLTFDQRALVDYEVMLRAGLVAARCESPFAWQLVLRRVSAFAGVVGGESKVKPHDGYRYQDRYSALFGRPDCGATMQASIWP